MSVETANPPEGCDGAREALADIQACSSGLQSFVFGAFDRLDRLADDLLARGLARQRDGRLSEQEALREQIDRLVSVVAELAGAKNRNGREKNE